MVPLMTPAHPDFLLVRRHADELRTWFSRETGWPLHIERDCARLYKRPADLRDASRGLPDYDVRRYVLLCLACAVLERADPQITLRLLGDRLLSLATEPTLLQRGFRFDLQAQHERRELVAICRTLLDLGVLHKVAGDEEDFLRSGGDHGGADALYDVHRRALAGMLAAVRGPSTWSAQDAPVTLDERISAMVGEHVTDSDEGRRTALRHHLSRRLLDDPVVYFDTLDAELRAYFMNQRGAMASRLCDATDLLPEQRAEGLALIDAEETLTDIAMPAEGTEAHVTLLVAEFLANRHRDRGADDVLTALDEITAFLAEAKKSYSTFWRKSARIPGAEVELAGIALDKLQKLQLITYTGDKVLPLPALARYAVGQTEIKRMSDKTHFHYSGQHELI
ncbi:TIGR02678 family protein [Janthinobacterium sp. PC23-8]|nr:TIGR02678 family protein [Janthinobacterium sp. PC23-8]